MPLSEIRFSISPFSLTYGSEVRYQGRHIFFSHQFGFWRVNVDTGQVQTVVGIGYNQPVFPPPQFGYVNGDYNQSCSQIAVSEKWIVLDVLAPAMIGGVGVKPSALIFSNDANCTKWGYVPQVSGYWWNRSARPRLSGDLCSVKSDHMDYDVFNCATKKWAEHRPAPLALVEQQDIDGIKYSIALDGDPWASGSYKASKFIVKGTGVVVVPPPPPPPPPVDPPPPTPLTLEQRVRALELQVFGR